MSLRTKLVIEGDASGAQKAAQDAQRAMGEVQRETSQYATGARGAARDGGVLSAANDNVASSFRNAAGSIAIIHGPLGGVASRFSAAATLAGRLGLAGGALAVGIGAATFAAQRGVRAFAEYDRQLRTTTALVSATGMAAGRTAEDIERLSREIGLGTLAATNEVRQAAGQLLTFRSVAGETFDRTLRAAQDLAAVGFGSITSAAVQLGKALEDPEQGITRLERSGISFTRNQRELIRNFVETGRVADAQRLILAQVEKQVGGAGAAAAGGLAGAFDSLTEQSGRWFELVGRRTADVLRLRDGLNWLANAIGSVNEAMESAGTPSGTLSALRQREQETRALIDAQRDHLEFMRSSGYTDAQIEMEAPGLLGAMDDLAKIREQMREVENIDEQLRRMEDRRRQTAIETSRREQRQGLIDGEIDRLRRETEELGRTELANLQLQAVRRAGVAIDSEAGQQIAELVRHNYELAEAQRQAAGAGEANRRQYEAGRQAVRDLLDELDRELEILRETDPVQQEMIRHRETLRYATELETKAIREKIAVQINEREAMKELQERYAFQRELLSGFVSDLRRAAREGTNLWEALGNSMMNVADRVTDKLINDMLDAIFKVQNAASSGPWGGGGGGVMSWLFGLLFGGGSGLVSGPFPSAPALAPAAPSALASVAGAPPVARAMGAGSSWNDGLTLRLEIDNRSGAQVQAGAPRQEGNDLVLPMIIGQIESAMASSVQSNGPLGRSIQQVFQLQRTTR